MGIEKIMRKAMLQGWLCLISHHASYLLLGAHQRLCFCYCLILCSKQAFQWLYYNQHGNEGGWKLIAETPLECSDSSEQRTGKKNETVLWFSSPKENGTSVKIHSSPQLISFSKLFVSVKPNQNKTIRLQLTAR